MQFLYAYIDICLYKTGTGKYMPVIVMYLRLSQQDIKTSLHFYNMLSITCKIQYN